MLGVIFYVLYKCILLSRLFQELMLSIILSISGHTGYSFSFNFYQCDGLEIIIYIFGLFFLNQVYYLNKIGVLLSEFLLSNFLAIFRHMVSID